MLNVYSTLRRIKHRRWFENKNVFNVFLSCARFPEFRRVAGEAVSGRRTVTTGDRRRFTRGSRRCRSPAERTGNDMAYDGAATRRNTPLN